MATWIFIFINLLGIIIVFIFSRIGAISWELVLTKKHNNDLENFMVVMALFFATAYGGAIAFSFDDLELTKNNIHLIGTILFFLFMNIVVLISTSILMTYLISAFRNTSRTMLGIFLLINMSLFVHEVVSFDKTYYKPKNDVKTVRCINLNKK